MKASEYGGSDTHKTQGIQPAPHDPGDVAHEGLRLLYGTDPADETSGPDQTQPRRPGSGGDRGR
jgi:hypothetical protein